MSFNFDFINVDDIQNAEVRSKFETEKSEKVKRVAGILNDPSCPRPLKLAEIAVVFERAYGAEALPTLVTLRAWCNDALASGLISKPSKQTYGPAGLESVADDDDDVSADAALPAYVGQPEPVAEVDPLDI